MIEFLAGLKRRKLVQWAIAYVAFAFALIQVLDVVAQQFGWPESLRRGVTLTAARRLPLWVEAKAAVEVQSVLSF